MNALLNYPGAKWGMAEEIVALMPPHRSYLEPFFGSGAVLFNKPPSAIETVNDIDGDIVNFFTVLREQPEELARLIELTPYARDVFDDAHHNRGTEPLDRAYRFAIRSKDVDPVEVCKGRPVGLSWFSPDCKHFSKAKGSALVDRNIRGLAWFVLRWAAKVRPRVIMLENVEEFQTWGPVRKGKPIKKKAGQTSRSGAPSPSSIWPSSIRLWQCKTIWR